MAAQNKLIRSILFFTVLCMSSVDAIACEISSCKSKSSSCQSTCGPGNPAAKAGIGNFTAGSNVQGNAISQQIAGQQQQANLAAAQGHCNAAKSASDGACQSAIASCSKPEDAGQKSQAENAKKSCEAAEKKFTSQTNADKGASKMMEQLAKMAQGLMQKDEPSDDPKDDVKEPTKCDRYNDMLTKEKNTSQRTTIKNLIAKECGMAKKAEGKVTQQAAEVRGEEAVREADKVNELDIADFKNKDEFLRKMLKCDEGSSLPECCQKPENERFCKSSSFNDAEGVEASSFSGGSSSSSKSSSNLQSENKKISDREVAGSGKKRKYKTLDISLAGGSGGLMGSGGSDDGFDDDDNSNDIKKPTAASVKLASQALTAKAQLGARGHDMFGAVTRRMRQNYMKGNLIQTQGVLFKRR